MLYPLSYEGREIFVLFRALLLVLPPARLHARSWYVAAWTRPTPTTPRHVCRSRACFWRMSNGSVDQRSCSASGGAGRRPNRMTTVGTTITRPGTAGPARCRRHPVPAFGGTVAPSFCAR